MRAWLTMTMVAGALCATWSLAGADPPLFRRMPPVIAGVTPLQIDPIAAAGLARAARAHLDLPLADGPALALDLERLPASTAPREVQVDGPDGAHRVPLDVTLWRGSVTGDPGSWAVIGMTGNAVCGTIQSARGRWSIAPPRAGSTVHRLLDDRHAAPVPTALGCMMPEPDDPTQFVHPAGVQAIQDVFTTTRKVCDVALDCDYDLYATRFGSNLSAVSLYVTTLLATVSLIYERDVNTSLRLVYLHVWTDPNDPYTRDVAEDEWHEFSGWWNENRQNVVRNVATLLSGRNMGGWGWYAGVCNTFGNGYSVGGLIADTTFPSNSPSFDVYLLAHELGHNFGLVHTQSCAWQAAGYVPPGALLDSCVVSEDGTCYAGPTHVPTNGGTIMSYCPIFNMRLEFHPACRNEMRRFIEHVCLVDDALQPPSELIASTIPSGVRLSWNASPSPGVIGYDIYRSAWMLDLAPTKVGTTTSTTFDDPGPASSFYKVRAVRSGDASAFSNEARPGPCTPLPQATSTQSTPQALATWDFNRDGATDLVVANQAAGSVSVMYGQTPNNLGIAKFSNPFHYPAGPAPVALAIGDVNGDLSPDLAVAEQGSDSVRVLLSYPNSPGAFQSSASWPACSDARDIVAADLDEDGIVDLVVACAAGDVSVLRGLGSGGLGNGTFAAPVTVSSGPDARAIAAGDFDRDGILDLAVAGAAGVRLLHGNGTLGHGNGTFTPAGSLSAGASPVDVVVADFNRDGRPDLAVANGASGDVTVRLGNGDGSFQAAATYACGALPRGLVAADWNQDGNPDLGVARLDGSGAPGLLSGRGDGTFDPVAPFGAADTPQAIAAGDFDRDGRPDLVTANGAVSGAVTQLSVRCAAGAPAALTLLSPNGGESWATGQERTVRWTRRRGISAVDLDVSRDQGYTWTRFASNVCDTAYAWTITEPASTHFRVRVVDAAVPTRSDASDNDFLVIPGALVDVGPTRPVVGLALSVRNPSSTAMTAELTLPRRAHGRLLVTDAAGRRMSSLALDGYGAGRHVVPLGQGWAPGVYLVRVDHDGASVTRKAVVLR